MVKGVKSTQFYEQLQDWTQYTREALGRLHNDFFEKTRPFVEKNTKHFSGVFFRSMMYVAGLFREFGYDFSDVQEIVDKFKDLEKQVDNKYINVVDFLSAYNELDAKLKRLEAGDLSPTEDKNRFKLHKDFFIINENKAHWQNKQLNLPKGLALKALSLLVENFGEYVRYEDFEERARDKASQELRDAIAKIRKEFERLQMPYHIELKRRHGYRLILPDYD